MVAHLCYWWYANDIGQDKFHPKKMEGKYFNLENRD